MIVIIHSNEEDIPKNYYKQQSSTHSYLKSRKSSLSSPKDGPILPHIPGQEFLFRNNIEVGRFVDLIVNDVLMRSEDFQPYPQPQYTCTTVSINSIMFTNSGN